MFSLPAGTQILLWTNVLVYLLDQQFRLNLAEHFALWPIGMERLGLPDAPGFYPWQLFTYAFLHGSDAHIFFNMFGLAMFGGEVERVWGRNRFLTYYFTCVLAAGVTQLLYAWATGSGNYVVGASGGVFGVLLAYAMIFPRRRLLLLVLPTALTFLLLFYDPDLVMYVLPPLLAVALFFPRSPMMRLLLPVAMPAWLMVTAYGLIELVMGVTGTMAGVAHFAHLGGMIGGWLLIRYGAARD